MLQRLLIRNFQKHQVLEVEFDEHITCIVGPSDAGKSAVLRALRWVVCNRPRGTGFTRHGSRGVRVTLNGVDLSGRPFQIVRLRRRGTNTYRLGRSLYKSLDRANIPDAVAGVLNVGDVSWQSQHDAPFWFAESPGLVAKNLNSVVNLDLIDKTLAHLAADLRKVKMTVEISKQRLKTAREQRNSLRWVKETDVQLRRLEEQEAQIIQQRSRCTRIASLVAEAQKVTGEVQEAAKRLGSLSRCVLIGGAMEAQRQTVKRLQQLLDECTAAESRVCQARVAAGRAEEAFQKQLQGKCPVCGREMNSGGVKVR